MDINIKYVNNKVCIIKKTRHVDLFNSVPERHLQVHFRMPLGSIN